MQQSDYHLNPSFRIYAKDVYASVSEERSGSLFTLQKVQILTRTCVTYWKYLVHYETNKVC